MSTTEITIRGAREHNLKNIDLVIPRDQFVVITGLSGSGKSSLAFDTVYSEGQRRYVETFSAYTRQFLDRMDRPRVDRIEGIPPAIAIDQTNPVRTSRSTVGTMTELNDHIKLLFARAARLFCGNCGDPVQRDTPDSIWDRLTAWADAYNEPGVFTAMGSSLKRAFSAPASSIAPAAAKPDVNSAAKLRITTESDSIGTTVEVTYRANPCRI